MILVQCVIFPLQYLHWKRTQPAERITEPHGASEENSAFCPTGNGSPQGATVLHRRDISYLAKIIIIIMCYYNSVGEQWLLFKCRTMSNLLWLRQSGLHSEQHLQTARRRIFAASDFPEISVGTIFLSVIQLLTLIINLIFHVVFNSFFKLCPLCSLHRAALFSVYC